MNREERVCARARVDARIIDEATRHEGTKVCNKGLAGERMREREGMHVHIRTQLLTLGNKNASEMHCSFGCLFILADSRKIAGGEGGGGAITASA